MYLINTFLRIYKIKSKKIIGLVNCPVSKEHLFDKNSKGVTEYLSKKYSKPEKEVMLIYNKNLAVSPITTHIRLSDVVRSLNKKIIENFLGIQRFRNSEIEKKNLIGIAPSIPQPNFTANVREFTLTGSFEAKRVEFTDTSVTSSACTYQYDFNGGTTGSRLNSSAHSSTFEAANLSGGIFEAGVSSPLTLGITFENPRAGTRCLKLYNGGSTAVNLSGFHLFCPQEYKETQ